MTSPNMYTDSPELRKYDATQLEDMNEMVDQLVNFSLIDEASKQIVMPDEAADKDGDSRFFPIDPQANLLEGEPPGVKQLIKRTGYRFVVNKSNRIYGGPPPGWTGPIPKPSCQVYVGHIPFTVREDMLVPIFEKCGRIWSLKTLMNPDKVGHSRGFAFVMYTTPNDAIEASTILDGYHISPGWPLKVKLSQPLRQLYLANIPKSKSKDEIVAEARKLSYGFEDAIVLADPIDTNKNRGYCFLNFRTHHDALTVKKKLLSTRFMGCLVLADWADPVDEPNSELMGRVKTLHVTNLLPTVNQDDLHEIFRKFGNIQSIRRVKDYAFILFVERSVALKALADTNGMQVHGVKIGVSLAKPPKNREEKELLFINRKKRLTETLVDKYKQLIEKVDAEMKTRTVLNEIRLAKATTKEDFHNLLQVEQRNFVAFVRQLNMTFAIGDPDSQQALTNILAKRISHYDDLLQKKLQTFNAKEKPSKTSQSN